MEFILNEYSLNGQYPSVEEFIKELRNFVGCIRLIKKNPDIAISKISNFYDAKITQTERVCDLGKVISGDDELKSFQISLDSEIYDHPPYWDNDIRQNMDNMYWWNDQDVSLTSMAEAAVSESQLLSFRRDKLIDCEIQILETDDKNVHKVYDIDSVFSVRYLVNRYGSFIGLTKDEILKVRYQGTRVDYSSIESEYGADTLQTNEYRLLVGTLDKFVEHESFETIATDDGLEYKKYSPSQKKKDWFSSAKYRRVQIMKIRCSDVMRVFGYRKGDRFRVLRIERDHKISNNG